MPRIRNPDENAIDWTGARRAPPQPVEALDLTVGEAPRPANDLGMQRARRPHGQHHGDPSDRPIQFRSEPDIDRHQYWAAFTTAAAHAKSSHDDMAIKLLRMQNAEHDSQLGALGFNTPRGWEGDLTTLTEMQRVPLQNGVSVGSLFKSEQLQLDKHDRTAIGAGADAVKAGRGGEDGIEMRGNETNLADKKLDTTNKEVKRLLKVVEGAKERVQTAMLAIEGYELKNKASDVREEIEALRSQASTVQEVVGVLTDYVAGAFHAMAGDVGDAVEKAGSVAAAFLGTINTRKIDTAMSKLAGIETRIKTVEGKQLASGLLAARIDLQGAQIGLDKAGGDLETALGERRLAYNRLALTTAEALPCPESSRKKIAGVLAAIPLVEIVVSRARGLSSVATAPAYNEVAGRGLGMAKTNGLPVADRFIRACGELDHVALFAQTMEGEWRRRLEQLVSVKRQILGERAGER
ncbi:MAG: hypothetical protein ACKV2T_24830 [Kofleriaceae bacterium]